MVFELLPSSSNVVMTQSDYQNTLFCVQQTHLDQLPSFDSVRSNAKDDLGKIHSSSEAELGVKSVHMNKVIVST